MDVRLEIVPVEKPDDINFILGHAHFIKTVEDLYETLVAAVPGLEFGLAFCEASGPSLVRWAGTSEAMVDLARRNAQALACGHAFIIFLKNAFPVNVLNAVKNVPEVCRIFCATANPTQVIVAVTGQGRGILGVIDGTGSAKVETPEDQADRFEFLRRIGYKLSAPSRSS